MAVLFIYSLDSLLISIDSRDIFESESKIIQVTRYCQLHT